MDILIGILSCLVIIGFLFCACVGFGEVIKTVKESVVEYEENKKQ